MVFVAVWFGIRAGDLFFISFMKKHPISYSFICVLQNNELGLFKADCLSILYFTSTNFWVVFVHYTSSVDLPA